MRFVDLFAGLGGFHLAAQKLGCECVFASELNEGLRDLYERNFGMTPEGDIRSVSVKRIGKHDLLCAGFPCQPFSKAGDQAGWEDAIRGSVFDRVVDILRVHRPEFVILENVAHFANHDQGSSLRRVRQALGELGYQVREDKRSPHQFGIPHFRERLFIVARRGSLDTFNFPDPTTSGSELSIKSVLDRHPPDALPISERLVRCLELWQEFLEAIPPASKLPSFPIWSMEFGATYPYDRNSLYEVPLRELRASKGSFGEPLDLRFRKKIMTKVPSHARAISGTFPVWKKDFIRQNRAFYEEHRGVLSPLISRLKEFPSSLHKLEWNCQGEIRDIWKYVIQFRASGVRVKRATTAPSLVAMTSTQVPIIAWEKRYMTALECARLQSLDELRELPKGDRAVEALGNAVNVEVVRRILEQLLATKAQSGTNRIEPSKPTTGSAPVGSFGHDAGWEAVKIFASNE